MDGLVLGCFFAAFERLFTTYVAPQLAAVSPTLAAALSSDDPGVLYDAAGAPITREWGRYTPIQGYYTDNGSDLPMNGIGNYASTGELEVAPAGMGQLMAANAGFGQLMAANAGIGRYIPEAGPQSVSGMGEYVKVVQGLGAGSYACPHCGAQGQAPAGASAFQCWSCRNPVSGLGDGNGNGGEELSIVGPMQRPGGLFAESVFGTVTASA